MNVSDAVGCKVLLGGALGFYARANVTHKARQDKPTRGRESPNPS